MSELVLGRVVACPDCDGPSLTESGRVSFRSCVSCGGTGLIRMEDSDE